MNKKWLKAAGIRAVRTMAQTALGVIGSAVFINQVDFKSVVSASILAAVVSLLMSFSGLPEVEENNG